MAASFVFKDGDTGGTPTSAANLNRLALTADLGTTGTPTGDALRAALDALYGTDTGWVTIPTAAGFGPNNGGLQLRRVGSVVSCRYGYSSTGITTLGTAYTVAAAGSIPAGLYPPASFYGWCGTNSVNNTGRVVLGFDGSVIIQPGGSAISPYYRLDPLSWMV